MFIQLNKSLNGTLCASNGFVSTLTITHIWARTVTV